MRVCVCVCVCMCACVGGGGHTHTEEAGVEFWHLCDTLGGLLWPSSYKFESCFFIFNF